VQLFGSGKASSPPKRLLGRTELVRQLRRLVSLSHYLLEFPVGAIHSRGKAEQHCPALI